MATLVEQGAPITGIFKWRNAEYAISNLDPESTTVGHLKSRIQELTSVLPERQKILGLTKTAVVRNEELLTSLGLKLKDNCFKFTLMGTPELELQRIETRRESVTHTVFNDLSCDFSSSTPEWHKLLEFTSTTTIYFINDPRPAKKLLVLDLDHTILHFTSKEEVASERMKRPYMDAFLSEIYPYYDIAVWSQTHWKWLEIKLTELGMLMHPHYKMCFVLDKSSMFALPSGKVKPLHIIWSKYPHLWNKQNTIHVDDLARNFELNKSSGLVIAPFNRTSTSSAGIAEPDNQLVLLSRYLRRIANSNDLSAIDHSKWQNNL